jgi:tetratricopeptide (TPR) repeat protein
MNLIHNKISKIFIITLFFLLFLVPTSYINSSPKNILVEDLLDKLQKAETIIEAEIIRKKIWNKWIYQVPNNLQQNLNYALDEFYSGRLASAEKAFTDLIIKDPNYAEGWNKRATIRYMLNDLDGSLKDIKTVLELQPRHFGAISGSGMIYFKKKKYQTALRFYKILNTIDPMNKESKKFIKLINKLIIENTA